MVATYQKALGEVTKSIRDLLTLKVTLPLGNPNLKLVHTNQFCFIDLPKEFVLANMKTIGNIFSTEATRYTGYVPSRWYIEAVTINHDGSNPTMELTLNPFASPSSQYSDAYEKFIEAYNQANSQDESSSTGKVSSVPSGNSSFAGGEGSTIDNLVEEIIGDETNILKKAKLIHKWLIENRNFKFYLNSRTHSPAAALKKGQKGGINCAGTSRLTASMMRSAGVDCYVVHSTCHYYTVIKYKGKLYCSDAATRSHSLKNRPFNTYWQGGHGSRCHGVTKKFQGKSSYGKKCGKEPCS